MIMGTETVVIHRKTATGFDAYGNATVTIEEINQDNVLIGWGAVDEPVEVDARPQVGKVTLYFEPGTVIEPEDSFEFHNTKWVKDGQVQEWESPFFGFETGPVVIVRQQLG